MTQADRSSQEYLEKLANNKIDYCHIDEFNSASSDYLLRDAFRSELNKIMNEKNNINVNQFINEILHNIYGTLNEQEKKNYIERYIKNMKFVVEGEELKVQV